jgi:hypothetical protein
MPWQIVERRIGRAGGVGRREARQREWDRRHGEGNWAVGYLIDGVFVTQEDAIESVYQRSYERHFDEHPDDLTELVRLARSLRNPHAEATTGVDLQTPTVLACLQRRGLELQGTEVVDVGTWNGRASHAISVRLSPLHVRCCLNPKWTLEQFWQEKKCLGVWVADEADG